MQLTVILSTRNNAGMLEEFLAALCECVRPESWEIIIVDNASEDNTKEIISTFSSKLPIKYSYQPISGKSISLNRGLSEAGGDIVLFTDDDVIPDKHWLVNHIRVMEENPDINIVGGRIIVDKEIMPSWLVRSYNLRSILVTEHDKGENPTLYLDGDYPFGPNMSVRKSRLAGKNNPWPENIGPGTRIPVGDESAFCRMISEPLDRDRLYDPTCIVHHRPRIGRNFFLQAVRRCFLGGYTAAVLFPALTRPEDKLGSLARYTGWRFLRLRSLQEFVCVSSRALGYGCGKARNVIGSSDPLLSQTRR